MSNIFNDVQNARIESNTFDLTHDVKLSGKIGNLMPCCVIDTIPGDNFRISGNALVRLAPTIAPVMHRMDVFIHYFFVPNRLLWEGWEDFITGGEDGMDAQIHPFVMINTDDLPLGSLLDYMGIPTLEDTGANREAMINPMALAAYQKIYDDYYRDENLEVREDPQLVDGDNSSTLTLGQLRKRHWAKDYFTSALPWTQRGPEALLPINGTAPLTLIDPDNVLQYFREYQSPNQIVANLANWQNIQWNGATGNVFFRDPSGPTRGYVSVEDSHEVDLSQATQTSIIELRRAFALQTWLEKNATGGARYIENISVHFGVTSSDKRLQRPEYIGGFQAPIKMSEVLQTSETSATSPQGSMAGHGISVGGSKQYIYSCEEHGYIIGILSVMPKPTYQQGIARHFRRFDKFDYAWPSFAHIGEQAIENIELYLSGTDDDGNTFGYTVRYAEYKQIPNRVAGDFRTSLDFWHMGRKFASLPPLNADFTHCDFQSVDRIFAVQDGSDHLWIQVLNQVSASRKLPVFGTPKIV